MHFSEFEAVAAQLLEQEKRLKRVEGELETLRMELREQPKRSEKDKKFYALIGLNWEEPSKTLERSDALRKDREETLRAIRQAKESIAKGLAVPLVVPLDPNPTKEGEYYKFTYRLNESFPHSVEGLADMLGLPVPLVVDKVIIDVDRVLVAENDPYFAKLALVEAFENARKAVYLKLAPKPSY